jgi:hypothetical protein
VESKEAIMYTVYVECRDFLNVAECGTHDYHRLLNGLKSMVALPTSYGCKGKT